MADSEERKPGSPPLCRCVSDPFASLPPEMRPRPVSSLKGLRKVTCPGCGLEYWTNRSTDLCAKCEAQGSNSQGKSTSSGG